MRILSRFHVVIGAALLAVSCGGSWEAEGMGALSSVVAAGQQGAWSGSTTDNVYWLENSSEEAAIRYYYTPLRTAALGSRAVSVDVSAEAGPDSRAGLLCGFSAEPLLYYDSHRRARRLRGALPPRRGWPQCRDERLGAGF